jgi:hypothetical protein
MQFAKAPLFCCTLVLLVFAAMNAQQAAETSATAVVPQLVNFSGKALDAQGCGCWTTHTAGVRFGRKRTGKSASPGRTAAR